MESVWILVPEHAEPMQIAKYATTFQFVAARRDTKEIRSVNVFSWIQPNFVTPVLVVWILSVKSSMVFLLVLVYPDFWVSQFKDVDMNVKQTVNVDLKNIVKTSSVLQLVLSVVRAQNAFV